MPRGHGAEAAGNGSCGVLCAEHATGNVIAARNVIGGNGFTAQRRSTARVVGALRRLRRGRSRRQLIGVGPGGEELGNESRRHAWHPTAAAFTAGRATQLRTTLQARASWSSATPALSNRITANSMHDDSATSGSISRAVGVTANDAGDADIGPNTLQNFPGLEPPNHRAAMIQITGTLRRVSGQTVTRSKLFASADCDSLRHGEGATSPRLERRSPAGRVSFTLASVPAASSAVPGGCDHRDGDRRRRQHLRVLGVLGAAGAERRSLHGQLRRRARRRHLRRDLHPPRRGRRRERDARPTTGSSSRSAPGRRGSRSRAALVTDTVDIDGTTQPGSRATPLIELDGSGVAAGTTTAVSSSSPARGTARSGLVLNGFRTNAIGVYGPGNSIAGNYIGTTRRARGARQRGFGHLPPGCVGARIGGPDAPDATSSRGTTATASASRARRHRTTTSRATTSASAPTASPSSEISAPACAIDVVAEHDRARTT